MVDNNGIPEVIEVTLINPKKFKIKNSKTKRNYPIKGLDFRNHKYGEGVYVAYKEIRKNVDYLDVDRPLHEDHNKMKDLVKSCKILDEVELTLGNFY